MRPLKISLSLLITIILVYTLNRGWNLGSPIPPLGKFLDPFHGFWQNATDQGTANKASSIPGLSDKVTIIYDSIGVPHIFATNDNDLYFTQGYVTANDRLWQMEFQTHAAAGRVSEIIGKAALDYDRRQRRLGMVTAAQNAIQSMESNPVSKAMVDSYSKGINAYISTLSYEDYPFEYKLLDYSPEPWSGIKCALLLKSMAQTLNMGEKDLEMTNALSLFGKDMIALLYPDREKVGDPIVDNAGNWKFKPAPMDSVPLALPKELVSLTPTEKSPPDVGSNNWAVSGSRTATGAPLLSNDPHLQLSLPSIWYIIHLNAPGVNTMGASLPGSPAVISGFNDSIAWGVTNAQRDLVDWYKIQFKDASKKEYLSDGAWKTATKVVERFAVKNGEPFYDTITYTHHGPVVFDESFHQESEAAHFAFRWIAHDPSEEIMTFYKLNRGKNHADYMAALDHYASPAQNFVFASVSGDIAMRIQGKYPVRRNLEGRFILDGTNTSTEWKAYIPNEQNVMYKNPARGFVSSANQYPVDSTYPYYVGGMSFEAYRNRRINTVLSGLTKATVKDMMNLQNDNYNLKAAESLPVFIGYLDKAKLNDTEQKALDVLSAWDYFNNIDSEGASYYEAWWDELMPLIWDEMDSAHVAMRRPTTFNTIYLLKHHPSLSFFDVLSTPEKETAAEVVQKAYSKGVAAIEEWKKKKSTAPAWGVFKDGFVGHLLRQEALSYHIIHGGNHDIVNAHSRTHGPSWRMVVSLEKSGLKAWGVYPGGQSGNPGSPYYSNMLEPWTKAQYFNMHFVQTQEQLSSVQYSVTQLSPAQ
ncbi:MAG TPA: penicillin acylase family protein [Cyclobacteriaceae bacterium]|nr:penicillin acylase family protein [Cyclobacteriaceae bacterium]